MRYYKFDKKKKFYSKVLKSIFPEDINFEKYGIGTPLFQLKDEHWMYTITENQFKLIHLWTRINPNKRNKLQFDIEGESYVSENLISEGSLVMEIKTIELLDESEPIVCSGSRSIDYFVYEGRVEEKHRMVHHPEVTEPRSFLGFSLKPKIITDAYDEDETYYEAIAEERINPEVEDLLNQVEAMSTDNKRLDLVDVWLAEMGPKNETDDTRRNLQTRGIKKFPNGWKVTKTNEADGSKRLILTGGTREVPSVEQVLDLNVVEE